MPNLIGTAPNQIGTNADHGSMAFQDENAVNIGGGSVQADLTGNSFWQNTDISTVQPTLKLDFDKMFALDPRITFGRASTAAYYDGKTFAVAEQNLWQQSQSFDAAIWIKGNSSVVADAMLAPDGTMTADYLAENSTASVPHRLQQAITAVASSYTISAYAKAGSRTWAYLRIDSSTTTRLAWFNLSTGALGTVQTDLTATITSVGNGWYRITATVGTAAAGTNYAIVGMTTGDGVESYSGDGVSGLYLWGAQLEQRSAVSAYTPTTSSAITNYIPQLMTAAANQARFDFDPITGEAKGLLVEEQRTNLLKYSSDPTNAIWTKQANVSVLANQAVAPDGTLTAAQLTFTSASTNAIYQTITGISASTAYTFSVWLKGTAGHKINITINYSAGGQQIVTQTLTGGWDRVTATGTTSAGTTNVDVTVYSVSPNALTAFIWGAQLELGSFATSYIPTTSAQVTRSADLPVMTGTAFSQWFNQGEGTIVVEAATAGSPTPGAQVFNISDNSNANYIGTYFYTGGPTGAIVTNGSVKESTVLTAVAANTFAKFVHGYSTPRSVVSANGGAVTATLNTPLPAVNRAYIGSNYNGGAAFLNGWIKRITYFPKMLSDAEQVEMAA